MSARKQAARPRPSPRPPYVAAPVERCRVVELRQYTLLPQRFAPFAALFEDEFVDPLDAAGMAVIGQFRDLDDPDRFVWLRGFRDMPARARALAAFYDGPLWAARRDAANANFIDTDDVLLLRCVADGATYDCMPHTRPPTGSGAEDAGLVAIAVYALRNELADDFPELFRTRLRPALAAAGIAPRAVFVTERAPNDFPRLPVREGERVCVWIASFAERARGEHALRALDPATGVPPAVARVVRDRLLHEPQLLRLAATPRSLLRGALLPARRERGR